MTRAWIVIWLGCAAAVAEESDGRKRLVFPPGSAEPLATPSPTPSPTPAPIRDPEKLVGVFFAALEGGDVEAAYGSLVRGTIIAERGGDVDSLKRRTAEALEAYGPIRGFEVVEELRVGENLLRKTCVSLNTDLPLRWRFYFYRSEGVWRLVDLRVDDGLVELFEDVSRRRRD